MLKFIHFPSVGNVNWIRERLRLLCLKKSSFFRLKHLSMTCFSYRQEQETSRVSNWIKLSFQVDDSISFKLRIVAGKFLCLRTKKNTHTEWNEKRVKLIFMVCYHVMNNNVAKGLLLWKNHVSKKQRTISHATKWMEIELKKEKFLERKCLNYFNEKLPFFHRSRFILFISSLL